MTWWQVLVQWLVFSQGLGSLPTGGVAESPPFWVTWSDGRRFKVSFHVTREA